MVYSTIESHTSDLYVLKVEEAETPTLRVGLLVSKKKKITIDRGWIISSAFSIYYNLIQLDYI
jgi:RNase P protein component